VDTLADKLTRIIQSELEGTVDLETLPNGHVCGHVVSPRFEDKDYQDRRLLIRDALLKHVQQGDLTDDEHGRVSTLLTYTPDEWNVVLSDTND
jgi:hypothetical protein